MLALMLVGIALIFDVRPALASGTIYIRADGSIDPPTAPISSVDDIIYTITDDISDSIFVERSNIIIDGNGHSLQGSGTGNGFFLNSTSNVTVKGTDIKGFEIGILLIMTFDSSIIENNLADNSMSGIFLIDSENNTIFGNVVTGNWMGIGLEIEVHFNSIVRNKITNNSDIGIFVNDQCNNNTITENYVVNNRGGIYIGPLPCFGNLIFHNTFINNTEHQALITSFEPSFNTWDDGYPSGGNYWSDYTSRYLSAQEIDDSGIWDIPYNIDENNQDNYPLIEPLGAPPTTIPTTIAELKAKIIELGSKGEISNQGIVNSLISKLDAAQKFVDKGKIDAAKALLANGFISQVQNLSGNQITAEAADLIVESAQYIISHL
jgi:parallel beta-helix repeat protein